MAFLSLDALDGLQGLAGMTLHIAGVINDVAEDAFRVDDVGDATDHAAFFIPRAERLCRFMFRVAADEPVAEATMLGKRRLARNQINA